MGNPKDAQLVRGGSAEAYRRLLLLVLRRVRRAATAFSRTECQKVRDELLWAEDLVTGDAVPCEIAEASPGILDAIEQCFHLMVGVALDAAEELRKIALSLNAAVRKSVEGGARVCQRLESIDSRLRVAHGKESLAELRSEIDATLEQLTEARELHSNNVIVLQRSVDVDQADRKAEATISELSPPPPPDPIASERPEAEIAIRDACGTKKTVDVVVIAVPALSSIRQNYGNAVAEQVFDHICQEVFQYARMLLPVYCWDENVFVLIASGGHGSAQLRHGVNLMTHNASSLPVATGASTVRASYQVYGGVLSSERFPSVDKLIGAIGQVAGRLAA